MLRLDELSESVEQSSGTGDGGGNRVGNGSAGAGAGRAGAGAGRAARIAGGGGVVASGIALPVTLDNVGGLEGSLELGAAEGTVGGLEVESTGNTLKGTELNPVKSWISTLYL